MKNRFSLFLLLFGLTVGIGTLLIVWRHVPKPMQEERMLRSEMNTQPQVSESSVPALGSELPSRTTVSPAAPATNTNSDAARRHAELVTMARKANQPVVFYGQVLDQNDRPLEGVIVGLNLTAVRETVPGVPDDRYENYFQTTDARGLFSFSNAGGTLLSVRSLEKEGYVFSTKSLRSYWYRTGEPVRHVPKSDSPEVFRMWKKLGAERLIEKLIRTGIPYDGTSVTFDLLTGEKVTTGGDLRVTLLRGPLQVKFGSRDYSWGASIEAVDGGLIESDDEFMYLAPEIGYQPRISITMPAGATNWASQKSVSFFLKSRHGNSYGRVTVKIMTDNDGPVTGFNCHSFINPASSRVLEYDPLQNVIKR